MRRRGSPVRRGPGIVRSWIPSRPTSPSAATTPALILGDRIVSWRELDARGNQAARALAGQGVTAGDRVAVALRNSIEFYEIVVGAGRLGATVMPVSFRFLRDEVEYLVDDAHATLVIAEPDNRDVYAGLPDTIFRGDEYEDWLDAESAMHVSPIRSAPRSRRSATTRRARPVVPRRSFARRIRTSIPSALPRHCRPAQAVFDMRLGTRGGSGRGAPRRGRRLPHRAGRLLDDGAHVGSHPRDHGPLRRRGGVASHRAPRRDVDADGADPPGAHRRRSPTR